MVCFARTSARQVGCFDEHVPDGGAAAQAARGEGGGQPSEHFALGREEQRAIVAEPRHVHLDVELARHERGLRGGAIWVLARLAAHNEVADDDGRVVVVDDRDAEGALRGVAHHDLQVDLRAVVVGVGVAASLHAHDLRLQARVHGARERVREGHKQGGCGSVGYVHKLGLNLCPASESDAPVIVRQLQLHACRIVRPIVPHHNVNEHRFSSHCWVRGRVDDAVAVRCCEPWIGLNAARSITPSPCAKSVDTAAAASHAALDGRG
mmetsp:Transcript_40143/g.94364  ORF Transcript_40143/g.94364 Transcript_40143/m.94364 type:complete len:265 (-) Transcript_40143:208-1002(-)